MLNTALKIVVSLVLGLGISMLFSYALNRLARWSVRLPDLPRSRQATRSSVDLQEEKPPVIQSIEASHRMLPRVCTWRPSERKILAGRQFILRGSYYDPVENALRRHNRYMTAAEVTRACAVVGVRLTRRGVVILLEALVILGKAKRKKSRQGLWVYK